MGNILGRDAFAAAASQLKTETVAVPELGGDVIIATLNVDRLFQLRKRIMEYPDDIGTQSKLWIIYCSVDEEGKQVFEDTPESMELLGKAPGAPLNRISEAAIGLNIKKPEDISKNSEASPNGNSHSDLQPISA